MTPTHSRSPLTSRSEPTRSRRSASTKNYRNHMNAVKKWTKNRLGPWARPATLGELPARGDRFIYLLVDSSEANGRREKYIGLTTKGTGRYISHLNNDEDGPRCREWLRRLSHEGRVPYHIILERAETLQQLQVLEILYIQALRQMGEPLMNMEDGGQSGSYSRSYSDPSMVPYTGPQISQIQMDIKTLIPPLELRTVYVFLKDMVAKYGGFHPEPERYLAFLAKEALLAKPEKVRFLLELPKALVSLPTKINLQVQKKKCKEEGCERSHHSHGFCHLHADRMRSLRKKLIRLIAEKHASTRSSNG